jgi:hypothetical protein
MPRILVLFLVLSFCALTINAQDKIHRKGGEVINAKVTEVGLDEVKYKLSGDPDGPLYSISKDRLVKVVYANGRVETYQNALNDKELYIGQAKHAIKLNFLSPLSGYTAFTYERSLRPGRSWELSLGIIGLGKNQGVDYYYSPGVIYGEEYMRSPGGVALGFGYKFIRTPDFINRNIRYAHLLQGAYLKPLVYAGTYGENIIDYKTGTAIKDRRNVTYGALMVELGKQWVFADKFLLDVYGGVGYCFDNIKEYENISAYSDGYTAHHFTNIRFGRSPGFTMSGGIRIGMLLGGKKE